MAKTGIGAGVWRSESAEKRSLDLRMSPSISVILLFKLTDELAFLKRLPSRETVGEQNTFYKHLCWLTSAMLFWVGIPKSKNLATNLN